MPLNVPLLWNGKIECSVEIPHWIAELYDDLAGVLAGAGFFFIIFVLELLSTFVERASQRAQARLVSESQGRSYVRRPRYGGEIDDVKLSPAGGETTLPLAAEALVLGNVLRETKLPFRTFESRD